MSIKTRNGIRTIHCSFCDANEQAMAQEFRECLDEWKGVGWRMFKKDRDPEWKHICPECRHQDRGDDHDS
jgi:hypothetical protein